MSSAAAKRREASDSKLLWRGPELDAADAMGRLIEFWGFRRHMGRLWTILYLSPEPMTTQDLSETLQLSSSAVSLSLGEPVRWGAVRKTWRPGERKRLSRLSALSRAGERLVGLLVAGRMINPADLQDVEEHET